MTGLKSVREYINMGIKQGGVLIPALDSRSYEAFIGLLLVTSLIWQTADRTEDQCKVPTYS